MKKTLLNAPERCRKSLGYSWQALKGVMKKEESFRLEAIAFFILVIILALCPWPIWKCLAMTAGFLLIPFAEVVNSAIEDICDGITHEYSPVIKSAKDKGALAVFIAIIINVFLLVALLLV